MAVTGIQYHSQNNLDPGNTTPHGAGWMPTDRHVWIANNADDDVYKYDDAGVYQSKASLPSEFTQPRGFCWVKSRAQMWGVDTGQNVIYRLNASLQNLGTHNLPAGCTTPEGILSFDSIGEVWIVNNSNRRIYRLRASDGLSIGDFALDSNIGDPRGGAYQPESNEAWILDNEDKLGRINANRQFVGTYALSSIHTYPRSCVSVGSKFWVVDNGIDKAVLYTINTDTVSVSPPATLNFTQNQAIAPQILPTATGGAGGYTYTLSGLPAGLSFDATTLQLTGAPTTIGTFSVTYTATDAFGQLGSATIFIVVAAPPLPIVRIYSGYPTRYVRRIDKNDHEDLNDYPIRLDWDQVVQDFAQSNVNVTRATIQSFIKHSDRKYEIVVRPPSSGTGTITVSVAANSVTGGNAAVSQNFTYTDSAGDLLFDWNTAIPGLAQGIVNQQRYGPEIGFVVEAKRIRILGVTSSPYQYKIWTLKHDGTRLSSEDVIVSGGLNIPLTYISLGLNLVQGRWFAHVHAQLQTQLRQDTYASYFSGRGDLSDWETFQAALFGISNSDFGTPSGSLSVSTGTPARVADINRWGLFFVSRAYNRPFARNFSRMQQNIQTVGGGILLAQGDRLVSGETVYLANSQTGGYVLPAETLNLSPAPDGDMAVYGNWYYYTSGTSLYRVDLQQYRVPAVRSRILPQFVKEGESLPLKHLVSGAETILFENDYDVPDYLSIDSNLNLVVGTLPTPNPPYQGGSDVCCLVKLRAFNRRYEIPVAFYLVVLKKELPKWKAIETLPMNNGETVNLFDLVPNATQIAWKNGFHVPSGYTLTDGQLTVHGQTSEAPTEVQLTATNIQGDSDKTFDVIVRVPNAIVSSRNTHYRLLIEGIEIPTEDLLKIPTIHHSLDVVNPNQYVADDATFVLSSDRGRYDGRVAGNFWDTNNLNKNGYLSEIELWVDILDTGSVQSKLLFQGIITEVNSAINDISVTINCVDRLYKVRNTPVVSTGIQKFAELQPVSETYQGEYTPGRSILPILRDTATVLGVDGTLPMRTYQNAREGLIRKEGGVYITEQRVLTEGGYLSDNPLLKFKTPYRRRDVKTLISQFAEMSGFYNTKVDIAKPAGAADWHISSRGNIAFNIEQTETVCTVVDWTHDATNDVFYQLLSHPSAYIQDGLVLYTPADDSYETVRTFDRGLRVTQFTTSDFDTFYIIATTAYDFDWIETPDPPNATEAVFDPLDSSRETDDTRILKYVKSTDTVSTFVSPTDTYPVQVGQHYMAGFENERHIRLREGIFSESRSTFRIHNNRLYYRYATWNAFGVARATAGGTTSALLTVNGDDYFNYLNYDFDITADGDVYMVYAEGQQNRSTLKVQQYDASAGTTAVIFQDTQEMWLGCHEVRLFNDRLYCVLPIQRVTDGVRDIQKSAGAVFAVIHLYSRYMEVLERYDYVQLSCRSLTIHDNHLYFAEYPNASTHYAPSNADLDGWNSDTRDNTVLENKVWLKRVIGDAVEAIIAPWYDAKPFNATAVQMLSEGSRLHAIVRYADKFDISAIDSDASNPENEQWVTLGTEIPYFIEDGSSNGTLYENMLEFAKVCNARLELIANRFRFVDLDATEALLSSALTDATTTLNYEGANKALPSSGHILIGKEIISYTGKSSTQLTGLTRGVGGTTAASHSVGDWMLYLDKLIAQSPIDSPYQNINIHVDTNKFYNAVRDSDNTSQIIDKESVDAYGIREFVSDFGLSAHQIAWLEYINAKTLNRLRDIRSVVKLQMEASYYLDIGDVVFFGYADEIEFPIQIIDIQHSYTGGEHPRQETHITGREVLPLPRVSFGNITVADKTWTQYSPITAFVLPEAEDPKDSYVYRLENLPTGARFDSQTREVSGFPIHVQSVLPVRYIVTDSENPTWSDALQFGITVNRAALAFVGSVPNLVFDVDVDIGVVKLPPARGGTGLINYALPNLPTGLSFDAILLELTGTPTVSAAAVSKSYTATDEVPATITESFTMQIVNALAFASNVSTIQGYTNLNYLMPAATGGLPPYTYTVTGLPSGLSFNASTRRLTGDVTNQSGIVYKATDSRGKEVTQTFSIQRYSSVSISGINQTGQSGSSYDYTLPAATGGSGSYTYTVTEYSDTGDFTWSFNASTRRLSVTYRTTSGDKLTLFYSVTDSVGQYDLDTCTFTVN